MKYIIPEVWCSLDLKVRSKLMTKFNIGKTEGTKIVDNKLVSDGVTADTLFRNLNIETMSVFLGVTPKADADVKELLSRVVDKLDKPDTKIEEKEIKAPLLGSLEQKPKGRKIRSK